MKLKFYFFIFFISFSLTSYLFGQNTIDIVNPPMTLSTGESVDITVNYSTEEASAYVLVRLVAPNGESPQAFMEASGSGSRTLTIKVPDSIGTGYRWQAQLLRTGNWGILADNAFVDGVSVEENTTPPDENNTLEFTATPSNLENGTTYPITISYDLQQTSIIYVQVFDDTATPWSKIGEYTVTNVSAGRDQITIDLNVFGVPSANNRVEAILFAPTSPWTPIDIEVPFVNIPGEGQELVFGPPADDDLANTQYFDSAVYSNGGNSAYERDLGDGYHSNWYVSGSWQGPIKAYFGPAEETAWIEWTNQKRPTDGSQEEFDIKIQKFSWHSENDGYPNKINQIGNAMNTESVGRWTSGSSGRGHINLTAWIYAGDNPVGDRCDVIVHTWDNSGRLRQKYDDNLDYSNPATGRVTRFRNIGTVTDTLDGTTVTYQVLRTKPGGIGELASFNLVPDTLIRNNPLAPFPKDTINARVGMKSILENVIALDNQTEDKVGLNLDWQLHGLEWTFTGQSGDNVDGIFVPNSKGRFTFSSYDIPNITTTSSLLARTVATDSTGLDIESDGLGVYPNPFTNSFVYEYEVESDEQVSVDLYALDGRKLKSLLHSESHGAGDFQNAVDASDLDAGVYILKISTSEGEKTMKLIKN